MTSVLPVLSDEISLGFELFGAACVLVSVVLVMILGSLGASGGVLSLAVDTGRGSVSTVVSLAELCDVGKIVENVMGLFSVDVVDVCVLRATPVLGQRYYLYIVDHLQTLLLGVGTR